MNKTSLKLLLRESNAAVSECTAFCPDDQVIAAYVDDILDAAAQDLVDRHLFECQACVNRVGLLANIVDGLDSSDEHVHAPARIPAAPHWAIAASVLIAVGLMSWVYRAQLEPAVETSGAVRATRSTNSAHGVPELLAPRPTVIEANDEFVFRWTDVPGSLYYDVRIVSDIGDLVDVQRIRTTEWRLDRSLHLEPGRDYFIQIDAYQTDFRPVSSDHLLFRLRE